MASRLERAAFLFAQSIRTKFAENVHTTFNKEWHTLTPVQQQTVLGLVEDAICSGHVQAYPWLLSAHEADADDAASAVTLPDAAIDQAADMVGFSSAGKRQFAAFTIVRDEPFFLNLWCSYYSRAFGEENLYVLDNSTSDGSVSKAKQGFPRINVVPVPSVRTADWRWCTDVVKCFQRIFLRGYDVVAFSDADEYLVPETGEDLRGYCERFRTSDRQRVRARGWGVVHQIDTEPQLSPCMHNVLEHRQLAWRAPQYDKTLISKVPLDWAKGNHTIYVHGKKASDDPIDHDLSLVHLRDVDAQLVFDQCARRIASVEPSRRMASFHAMSDIEQVKTYLRTRRQPWKDEERLEYADECRHVPEAWRKLL